MDFTERYYYLEINILTYPSCDKECNSMLLLGGMALV